MAYQAADSFQDRDGDFITIKSRPHSRIMGKYLVGELRVLADVAYLGHIPDDYNVPENQQRRDVLVSLERFGLVGHASYTRRGHYAGWTWVLTEEGRDLLTSIRARRYPRLRVRHACCEYAVRLPCVCSESVYCPNPEHPGGCHGTHD